MRSVPTARQALYVVGDRSRRAYENSQFMIGTPGSRVRKRTVYVASALEHPVETITPPLRRKRAQKVRPSGRGRGAR